VPLSPHEIDASNLPHATIGGFKPEPVVALLRRVAWDYGVLFHENRKLAATVEELQKNADELTSEIEALRSANAGRRDPDDAARAAIAAAQRAARELRESARRDCELALKKARRRAAAIETELERLNVAAAEAELHRVEELQADVRERLEAWLLSTLVLVDAATGAESSTAEPSADGKRAIDSELLGRLGETAAAASSE
jgi:cell division septum initiation protein DivIVA